MGAERENSPSILYELHLNGKKTKLLSTIIDSGWKTGETEIGPSGVVTQSLVFWPLTF